MSAAATPAADLDAILERNRDDFELLRGARILVTGGTGFVGRWLLDSFAHAARALTLGAQAVVVTRDPAAFAARAPHLCAGDAVRCVRADVRAPLEVAGPFDAIVHAATPASAAFNADTPRAMIDTIVDGTRNVLDVARRSGAIPLLLTSSGAVYGRQPPDLALIDESFGGGPDPLDPRNAYHEAKRAAELLCAVAAREWNVAPRIARMFAFVGPHLPLDRHFAIGNFIRDALQGGPVVVNGDGTPVRSYLYAGDMTSWLWRILLRGQSGRAYNVGSERTIAIRDLAGLLATAVRPAVAVEVRGEPRTSGPTERYVCATARARAELGLAEWTSLEEAMRKTLSATVEGCA